MSECKYLEGCSMHMGYFKIPKTCTYSTENTCNVANIFKRFPEHYEKNLKENRDFREAHFTNPQVAKFRRKYGFPPYKPKEEDFRLEEIGIGAMVKYLNSSNLG